MKIEYSFFENVGVTICTITDIDGYTYEGVADCHKDDFDMLSEKTGCEIAHDRAIIKYMKQQKRNIQRELKALRHLESIYNMSSKSDKFNYENKMLRRQIHNLEIDLDAANVVIATEEQNLKRYIKDKDKFYQQIRALRAKGQK